MGDWQLQDAKARFSELVRLSQTDGPQVVTVRGERSVVVMSAVEYDRLTARRRSLVDVIRSGPAWPEEMHEAVEDRSKEFPRDIDL